MAAYFTVKIKMTNPGWFEENRQTMPPIIEKHGGQSVVAGGNFEVLEGRWNPERVMVFEFPSMEKARGFYPSKDYKPLLELRTASTNSEVVLADRGA